MSFRTMDELWMWCIVGLAADAAFSVAVAVFILCTKGA
jgi:hypothetical protein